MGYLNNQIITVDAILTKKGRELISDEDGSFRITQFALSDDEIDYTLYNPNHPSGSAYYGEAIERMPIIEAFPDERYIMKYKLVSLPLGTEKIIKISLGIEEIILEQGAEYKLTPDTLNYPQGESYYIVSISDGRLLEVFKGTGMELKAPSTRLISGRTKVITTEVSKSIKGLSFSMVASRRNIFKEGENSVTGTITVEGGNSGASKSIPITIKKYNK